MPDGHRQEPGGWNRVVLGVCDLEKMIAACTEAGLKFRNEMEVGPAENRLNCFRLMAIRSNCSSLLADWDYAVVHGASLFLHVAIPGREVWRVTRLSRPASAAACLTARCMARSVKSWGRLKAYVGKTTTLPLPTATHRAVRTRHCTAGANGRADCVAIGRGGHAARPLLRSERCVGPRARLISGP